MPCRRAPRADQCFPGQLVDRLQCRRVDDLDVFEIDERLRTDELAAPACGRLGASDSAVACVAVSWSARESTVAADRCSSSRYAFRLDIAIPSGSRTSGQPTTSTGRSRSRAILRTTASCCASLRPKYASARPDDREQLGDHRRDPVEVAGAARTAEAVGEPPDVDGGSRFLGVHLVHRGREEQVDAFGRCRGRIASLVTRVAGEILVRAELRRVHEERDDDEIALAAAARMERPVTRVERAHGRHQPDRLVRSPRASEQIRRTSAIRRTVCMLTRERSEPLPNRLHRVGLRRRRARGTPAARPWRRHRDGGARSRRRRARPAR